MLPEKIKNFILNSVSKRSLNTRLENLLLEYDKIGALLKKESADVADVFRRNMYVSYDFHKSSSTETISEIPLAAGSASGEDNMDFLMEYSKHSSNFTDMPYETFCETIFKILSSDKSDDQLQNELFDMLGFNSFEFISNLLKNREYYCQPSTSKL